MCSPDHAASSCASPACPSCGQAKLNFELKSATATPPQPNTCLIGVPQGGFLVCHMGRRTPSMDFLFLTRRALVSIYHALPHQTRSGSHHKLSVFCGRVAKPFVGFRNTISGRPVGFERSCSGFRVIYSHTLSTCILRHTKVDSSRDATLL